MSFGINGYGNIGQNDLLKGLAGARKPANSGKKTDQKDSDAYIQKNTQPDRISSETRTELSDGAKKVLDELKEKYGNTDFFVADFANDEEASRILSNSTNEFGVVIKPEELERMAADSGYKEKIFNTISDSQQQLDEFKESLSDDQKAAVKSVGISIGDDGQVSFFAELEKAGKAQAERIRAKREEKSEEKKAEEKDAEKVKEKERLEKREPTVRKYVQSDNLDDLASKITEFLNSDNDEEALKPHFDFKA